MIAMDYELMAAEELVGLVLRHVSVESVCFTSSFQLEDMVVLDMVRRVVPRVPVIFLETGYHFREVLEYRDRMTEEWGLNLVNAMPSTTVKEFEGQYGVLNIVQPTECCRMRKVEPLIRSLEPFEWWFTGLRREQSPTRAGLKKVEDHRTPTGKQMKKVSVLADWKWAEVSKYAETHGIPRLSLYDKGYTSIGCEPCTAIPAADADARSGRWGGKKLECGIHTFSEKS
jgi:phosphoadenosine phosphosulfate reductase